ncbi:MAG: TonB-dependent receptor [Cellvibrionaceae bacterium]
MLVPFCLVFSPLSLAQSDEDPLTLLYGDEETVSIATGTTKPLRLAPSVASVITADDIKAMGAQNLDEVLQSVPGLHVSLSVRYSSLISVRGIHTKTNPQVLMLIDGYPITELYSGTRPPTLRIPVNNIERVEVIRGPGSAIYGADAFAGVVNIITKDVQHLESPRTGISAGSFDTYGAWLQSSSDWFGWNWGLSVELTKSDGDDDRIIETDLQGFLDTSFGSSATLAPQPAATHYDILNTQIKVSNGNWRASVNSWKQDKGGLGAGVAEALDPEGYLDVEQHLVELAYAKDNFSKNWRLEGRINYFYLEEQSRYNIFPPGTVLPIGSDGNLVTDPTTPANLVTFTDGVLGNPGGTEQSGAFELVGYYSGLMNHRLRLSTGYKSQGSDTEETKNFGPGVIDGSAPVVDGTLTDVTGTDFIYMRDQNRNIKHLSVQDEWSFYKDWELTAGLRYDDYSDFGDTVNPRLALVWQTGYNLTTKLLYGRAFRAPSFSEQFVINNPVERGNLDLDPEKIDTYELSFDYRPRHNLATKLNLFHYDIDGLIDLVDDDGQSGGTKTSQNAFDQEGYGFEIEAIWDLSSTLTLAGNYSWQRSEDKATGRPNADAPEQLVHADLRWNISPTWRFTAQAHHVANRNRSFGDTRDEVDDYTLVNINLIKNRLFDFADIYFSVHNLFDEDAREPSAGPSPNIPNDHPLPGRQLLVEAIVTW